MRGFRYLMEEGPTGFTPSDVIKLKGKHEIGLVRGVAMSAFDEVLLLESRILTNCWLLAARLHKLAYHRKRPSQLLLEFHVLSEQAQTGKEGHTGKRRAF